MVNVMDLFGQFPTLCLKRYAGAWRNASILDQSISSREWAENVTNIYFSLQRRPSDGKERGGDCYDGRRANEPK